MNWFINILVGWMAFGSVIILGWTGRALERQTSDPTITANDYLFIALVVASIFFLQYAVDRYLIPPTVFNSEQKKRLLEGAGSFYRKTFFRGAIGLSHFFLILYVFDYFSSALREEKIKNSMVYAVFFLVLGLLARARGIILHLANGKRPPELDNPASVGQER